MSQETFTRFELSQIYVILSKERERITRRGQRKSETPASFAGRETQYDSIIEKLGVLIDEKAASGEVAAPPLPGLRPVLKKRPVGVDVKVQHTPPATVHMAPRKIVRR